MKPADDSPLGMVMRTMKFMLIFFILGALLTACSTNDGEVRRQVVGKWSKETTFSWIDPVLLIYTISPDGSFSESLGHRSEPVTFQGTWLVKGGELVLTITNAQGTGKHQPALSEIGKVKRWKIVRLDDHQFIYTTDGRTNLFAR